MLDPLRLRAANAAPLRGDGTHVLYWMTAARRTQWNPALEYAIGQARALGRPLVILEALRTGYPYASDRLHRFAIQGMRDNQAACRRHGVAYLPYVEPSPGAGRGLVEALAATACLAVGDDAPVSFLPRMIAAAAPRLACRLDLVDGNGLLPLRAADRAYERAMDFRRHLQRVARPFLGQWPAADPLAGAAGLPAWDARRIDLGRWPPAEIERLLAPGGLAGLPIDHAVGPVSATGGAAAAQAALAVFLGERLHRYGDERSHPDSDASSDLSPWLHWGHLSAQQVVRAVLDRAGWTIDRLGERVHGRREGWWGIDPSGESFLDELITWRELGYGFCHHRPDHAGYASQPAWARATLAEHACDPRPVAYAADALEAAATHDPVWNAAQRQLVRSGRLHNYLRMLWGKKILEWSPSPEAAWEILFRLNDRWALDGRDPNSSSGIGWVFGRFDRPWAPRRPIFGTIRYMSSDSTVRKLRMRGYLATWG